MPIDRGAIDAQLREIGEGERWWEQREFRDLPYILGEDERLQALVVGKLFGSRRPRVLPAAHWLIVATTQRLICLKKERFGRQQLDVPLGQIMGMRHATRLRGILLLLETPMRRLRIRLPKEDAFRFMGALTALLTRPPAGVDPALAGAAYLPGVDDTGPRGWNPFARPRLLSGPAPVTREDLARVEATVERMEREIERLQQHVEFLENLLEKRAEGAFLPGGGAGA